MSVARIFAKTVVATCLVISVSACGKKGDVKPPSREAAISAVFAVSAPFLAPSRNFLIHSRKFFIG